MISTTYVTTLPSSTSNVDKIPSVDHQQNHMEHMDHSPLSLLVRIMPLKNTTRLLSKY